jgi:hypothetical protein
MRGHKRIAFAVAAAMASALAFAAISTAAPRVNCQPGDACQTATVTWTDKGKAEKSGTPGSLRTQYANTDDPSTSSPIPPRLNTLRQELSSGIVLDQSLFPVCTTSLEGLTADQAQAACGNTAAKSQNALVGTASATVQIGTVVVEATGLAFNGPGELTVFIRADALNVTTIIHCALSTGAAPYKQVFNCPVPPLAGGAGAVTSVDFTFERIEVKKKGKSAAASKKKKKKKKTLSLLRGKCPSSGQYENQTTFTYDDHETIVLSSNQPC